ncbi:DUF1648 domain-containing protein [Streptosporangium sp. NPDC051022]|uniref:DUF1648 domain-containing protein n=1 Tax=Streptosporangium sp. NPDC051022 TaxID=3155752 RepID=UPI00344ADB66
MTLRGRVALALAWGALVTALMIGIQLALRDRLPGTLATHWNGAGTPDGHMSFTANLLFDLLFWVVPWIVLTVLALRDPTLRTRLGRAYWSGFLFGWSVLAVGMQVSTLLANLGVADWRQATLPAWQVGVVIAAAVAAGVLAGLLGRGGPDPRHEHPEAPAMRLRPGQRAVWVGRTTNPWLVGLSLASLVGALAVAVFAVTGVVSGGELWIVMVVLTVVTVLGLGTSSISVRADVDGLRVGFGPLGRPVRRTPIAEIESAWAETISPAETGGWGLRGLPGTGRVVLMLRAGECLVVRRVSGGEFAVSVDDAERAAALLNAYVAETVDS